ncbi:MAG: zinc ribbon domain-containing protein [Candidatus Hermodarchaeota archaeon]
MFHEYDYSGYHMMDMEFGNWFYIILGIVVILLSIIILIYFFLHYSNQPNSQSLLENEKHVNHKPSSNLTDTKVIGSNNANFCHNCGQKLDDNSVKFCPYCGEEI